MTLPASGPISGSQIYIELFGTNPNNASLGGMIDSSSLSNTDPDKYSDFYGYSNITSFYGASTISKTTLGACSTTTSVQYWHNGSGALPAVGDFVYTNSTGTTTASWIAWKGIRTTNSNFSTYALQLDKNPSTGEVVSISLC